MPTHITQVEDHDRGKTILRVDGELLLDDALLVERLVQGLLSKGGGVTIDLADLDLIDSDAAPVMKRVQETAGVEISGIEIFLQNMVNDTERQQG